MPVVRSHSKQHYWQQLVGHPAEDAIQTIFCLKLGKIIPQQHVYLFLILVTLLHLNIPYQEAFLIKLVRDKNTKILCFS